MLPIIPSCTTKQACVDRLPRVLAFLTAPHFCSVVLFWGGRERSSFCEGGEQLSPDWCPHSGIFSASPFSSDQFSSLDPSFLPLSILLLTLWSPTEREVCVCVSRGAPLPKFLPNHTDPSLAKEGFLEEEGRACVQKGGERIEVR